MRTSAQPPLVDDPVELHRREESPELVPPHEARGRAFDDERDADHETLGPCDPDPPSLSDADRAMAAYVAGEVPSFRAVHAGVTPALRRFFLRRGVPRCDVDDLVQITLLRVHSGRTTFQLGQKVVPWALAIARRTYIDAHRRGRIVGELGLEAPDEAASSRDSAEMIDVKNELRETLKNLSLLPNRQAEGLGYAVDGRSVESSAAAMGVSTAAYKSLISRARASLRRSRAR